MGNFDSNSETIDLHDGHKSISENNLILPLISDFHLLR